MYYLIPYFICMFYQIYDLKRKGLLHSFPAFLILSIPIAVVCYTSLYLGRFSFVLQYIIAMSIFSIISLVGIHLVLFPKNILSHIHTRYFYISSIFIYLYVFTSLNGKNIGTAASTNPLLSSIFTISMCIFMLFILNSISEKEKEPILWWAFCSFKLFIITIIANVSIYFFTVHTAPFLDSRMTILFYGLPLLIPYLFRIYDAGKNKIYQTVFSTGFGMMILLFFILSTTDFIFPNIPLLYYYDIFIHRGIQIGLYATILLLLPTMKRFPYSILYHTLAFIILILCLLIFW